MSSDLFILALSAISVAFLHTVLGPDHYLPFIVMQKARKWSLVKTIWITVLCGIGHVGSSLLIGMIGVVFGVAIHKIQFFESFRGNIAAWFFIAFGLGYMIWGIRQAFKKKTHTHSHFHFDGTNHVHQHTHLEEHTHIHSQDKSNITPWILFTIFIFGPCEPLIPIIMYPASKGNYMEMGITTLIFGITTIGVMLGLVLLAIFGINQLPLKKIERFNHALAGGTLFFSGFAILVFGL